MTRKGVAILGSTGSIGTNALDIVRRYSHQFEVISLAAGRNQELFSKQLKEFSPKFAFLNDEAATSRLQKEFPNILFCSLKECLVQSQVSVVVVGIAGFAALEPTLEALENGKTVALANKEALVVAGRLIGETAKKNNAICIPVDSEHNALFQLLEGRPPSDISKLILTASGGPLFRFPDFPLDDVTPDMAVRHPNWKMGPKISVDSATLMNKGLELIEAHFLFQVPESSIDVWIHPQSILHGAICLKDNSFLAQLSAPDMRGPLAHAMNYPNRLEKVLPFVPLTQLAGLEFKEPDPIRFPCLTLAREALRLGPSHLVVLNAANEIAVEKFLKGDLLFSYIPRVIEKALDSHREVPVTTIEQILALDFETRNLTSHQTM